MWWVVAQNYTNLCIISSITQKFVCLLSHWHYHFSPLGFLVSPMQVCHYPIPLPRFLHIRKYLVQSGGFFFFFFFFLRDSFSNGFNISFCKMNKLPTLRGNPSYYKNMNMRAWLDQDGEKTINIESFEVDMVAWKKLYLRNLVGCIDFRICVQAKGLVIELTPLYIQSFWGFRRENVRIARLAACCNYL